MSELVYIIAGVIVGVILAIVIYTLLRRREHIDRERDSAIKLDADVKALVKVTNKTPNSDDFERWFGTGRKEGDADDNSEDAK